MEKFLMIGVGAVAGALCRHWVSLWSAQKLGTHFAYGTLFVNLIGSFALGLFLGLHLDKGLFTPNLRYLVAVGFCGSFTTYSTFSWETLRYFQEGNFKLAAVYLTLTLAGCLVGAWAGMTLAKAL